MVESDCAFETTSRSVGCLRPLARAHGLVGRALVYVVLHVFTCVTDGGGRVGFFDVLAAAAEVVVTRVVTGLLHG